MKRTLKIIGVSILILILCRGFIFRLAFKYHGIGTRPEIKIIDRELLRIIESKSKNRNTDLKSIIEISSTITKNELDFSSKHTSNNPNVLIHTHKANCVGYAAMFNSTINHLIRINKLQNNIEAEHNIGQLDIFEINLHQYFESPFMKDHDFNTVTNKKTGEKISVDLSVADVLWINRISVKN